jgi:hypothetical protein
VPASWNTAQYSCVYERPRHNLSLDRPRGGDSSL